MKAIVLQHIKVEDPGYIKDLMLDDGWKLTTVELDEGDKIPANINHYDAMLCMAAQWIPGWKQNILGLLKRKNE